MQIQELAHHMAIRHSGHLARARVRRPWDQAGGEDGRGDGRFELIAIGAGGQARKPL